MGKSTASNVTDDLTNRLNDIVCRIKQKKGIGIRLMKSWEREKEIIRNVTEEVTKAVREESLAELEAERRRADRAEAKVKELESQLAAVK